MAKGRYNLKLGLTKKQKADSDHIITQADMFDSLRRNWNTSHSSLSAEVTQLEECRTAWQSGIDPTRSTMAVALRLTPNERMRYTDSARANQEIARLTEHINNAYAAIAAIRAASSMQSHQWQEWLTTYPTMAYMITPLCDSCGNMSPAVVHLADRYYACGDCVFRKFHRLENP